MEYGSTGEWIKERREGTKQGKTDRESGSKYKQLSVRVRERENRLCRLRKRGKKTICTAEGGKEREV